MIYGDKVTPLPIGTTAIIFILCLLGSMSITMMFSFLPQLVKSFGISEVDIGHYAGIIAAALFAGRAISSMLWGYLTDLKGAKFATILSATTLSIATLAFGFSTFYKWALVTRFLQGLFMGINVATKALTNEICDDTNQEFGITILTSSYSTGLVIGPSIGAYLAFPVVQYPKLFTEGSPFGRYPVLLPILILVLSFVLATSLAVYIFLTDERKKKLKLADMESELMKKKIESSQTENETGKTTSSLGTFFKDSKIMRVLCEKDSALSCILYGIYPPIYIVFDELFPVLAATSKKYGGFGFSTINIGEVLTAVAIISLFAVIPLATKLIKKYRAKTVFIYCTVLQSLLFPVVVLLAHISNTTLFWILLILVMVIIRLCMDTSSIAATLILNNSVEANLVGTVNGIGMTLSGIGRMVAPPLFGTLFSWSLKNVANVKENKHPLSFPFNQYFAFYMLTITGILTAVFVLFFPNSINYRKESPRTK